MLYGHNNHTGVLVYLAADWVGLRSCKRSTFRYCVFIGNNIVSWKSKKQSVVTGSSAKAVYKAMTCVSCKLIMFKLLLKEMLRFGEVTQMSVYNKDALH